MLIGYGSGDAAEVLCARTVPGWQQAALRLDSAQALAAAVPLDQAAYERLHDEGLGPEVGADFVVERVGQQTEGVEDVGVEFYRYVGGR